MIYHADVTVKFRIFDAVDDNEAMPLKDAVKNMIKHEGLANVVPSGSWREMFEIEEIELIPVEDS